jgi:hypothetical protein
MIYRLLASAAAAVLCAPALAGINATFSWALVDNTVGNPGGDALNGALWNSNNWMTVDLFLTGDFMVNGVNLGSAPGEEDLGLRFGGDSGVVDVFNTGSFVASDFENAAQTTFTASLYDTYVTLGDNNPGGTAPNELLGIGFGGLTMSDGVLRGAWSHNPPNGGTPQDASNGIRILRISFDPDDLGFIPLGDPLFVGFMEIGTSDGVFTVAIPAPGAAGVFALAGLALTRRRR